MKFRLTLTLLIFSLLLLGFGCNRSVRSVKPTRIAGSGILPNEESPVGHQVEPPNNATTLYQQGPLQNQSGEDWISGGGRAPGHYFNPWFLKNTKKVYYCFKYDEKNFGLEFDKAKKAIREGLDFWLKEFEISRKALHSMDDGELYGFLGTQSFEEQEECTENTDLVVQLGVIENDQIKKYVVTPKSYLAVTVRTEYDSKKLKGKGFMYFSPARGKLKSNRGSFKENIWQWNESSNLKILAAHEWGHVFGTTNSNHHRFMDGDIMNKLIETGKGKLTDLVQDTPDVYPINNLDLSLIAEVHSYQIRRLCANPSPTQPDSGKMNLPYVGMVKCIRMIYKNELENAPFLNHQAFFEVSLDGENWSPYAKLTDLKGRTEVASYGQIYLPEEQEVFKEVTKGTTLIDTQNFAESRDLTGNLTFIINTKDHLADSTVSLEFADPVPALFKIKGTEMFRVLPISTIGHEEENPWVSYFVFEGFGQSNDFTQPGAHVEYMSFEPFPEEVWSNPFK